MAETPEVAAARQAAARAMERWTSVQRQTNDAKQITAARDAYVAANARANQAAASAAAKAKPGGGYGR